MHTLIDFILHLDKYLGLIIEQFGTVTYALLFFVIFCETGLVVMPFLPGDSLLFVAGTLAGKGYVNIVLLYVVFLAAAVLGDTANYWVGHFFGPKVFSKKSSRFLNPQHLEKTRHFFEKYGGKAIIIGRFIPIVRTFAPFVAGIGSMHYGKFIVYNIIGGTLWVTLFTLGGYFLGSLPIIQKNFHIAIFGIIGISMIPPVWEFVKSRKGKHVTTTPSVEKIEKTFEKQHISE